MAPIPVVARETTVDEVASHLDTEGCVIVERLLEESLLGKIDAQLAPLVEQIGTNNHEFGGRRTKRFNGLLAAVPATQRLAAHPLVIDTVSRLLLPYCARFQLNYDGLMHVLPEETAQALHRDGSLYPFRHPTIPYTIACMWAQTDFTASNGGTRIAPGSHHWQHERQPEAHEVVAAQMARGSVLIYTGGLFHGAGPNTSEAARSGIAFQYTLGWLRQELNMYLTYPPEVAKTFTDPVQRLIGYELAAPYLGFVDQGSPHRLLEAAGHDALRERSTPELEAAIARVKPLAFGPKA